MSVLYWSIILHLVKDYDSLQFVHMSPCSVSKTVYSNVQLSNRYMSGELSLPSQGGAPVNISTAPPPVPQTPATCVVELKNMVTAQDLQSDQDYEEILEDTKDECGQFGSLKSVVIPRSGPGATKVFLSYVSQDDATKAIAALAGRTFDGSKVQACYFSEEKFASQDYSS